MANRLCDELGIRVPLVLAPMAGAVGPELCAAVSNAGGLGTIPLWPDEPDAVRQQIASVRALTKGPFAVNLNQNWPQEERLNIVLDEGVKLISLCWGDPVPLIARIHAAGARVMQTCGSAEEARRAAGSGVDFVVAQGWEAGGHVGGSVSTLALVPAVVDAVGSTPVIAAGGIADGRGLAAVLALGAGAGWIGTRFLATPEATIHPRYRERLLQASEDDTVYGTLFDVGWAGAPHRTLRNETVDAWERAGRPASGARPGEGQRLAMMPDGSEVLRYQISTPSPNMDGNIDALTLWAGQGVGLVRRAQPAQEVVGEIWSETQAAIGRLAAP